MQPDEIRSFNLPKSLLGIETLMTSLLNTDLSRFNLPKSLLGIETK